MSIRFALLVTITALAACSSSRKKESGSGSADGIDANPVAKARLEARVANIKYQSGTTLIANLERIAAYGHQAVPVCLKGLEDEDPMTRMGCAYVLGRVNDPKTIPALLPLLDDEVAYVRYEAAAALGSMGSRAGYPVLVQGLRDERIQYRFKCIEALQDFTGHSFGYSHNAAPEAREVSVKQWEAWLERVEKEEL